MSFCLSCGDLLNKKGQCGTCTRVNANAIIDGKIKPSKKPKRIPPAGKHSLPIGMRDDAHRRGKGTGET